MSSWKAEIAVKEFFVDRDHNAIERYRDAYAN